MYRMDSVMGYDPAFLGLLELPAFPDLDALTKTYCGIQRLSTVSSLRHSSIVDDLDTSSLLFWGLISGTKPQVLVSRSGA